MGFNTVAVIFNDHLHEIEKDGPIGKRIAHSVLCCYPRDERFAPELYFGAGATISCSHSDDYQITVVHANAGRRIQDVTDLPDYALQQLADCLQRHGWRAARPVRRRVSK